MNEPKKNAEQLQEIALEDLDEANGGFFWGGWGGFGALGPRGTFGGRTWRPGWDADFGGGWDDMA